MPSITRSRFAAGCDRLILFSLSFTVFFLPIYNSLTSLGLGLALFFYLLRLGISGNRRALLPKNHALIFYALACLASALCAGLPQGSLVGLRKLALHITLYFAVFHTCRNEKNRLFLVGLFLSAGLLVSVDGFFQWATGSDWFSGRPIMASDALGISRWTASFLQAGALGIYLGGVLPIAACLALFGLNGQARRGALGATLIIGAALTMTLAPGAALGFLVMALFVGVMKKIRWPGIMIAIVLWTAFFFLPSSLTAFPDGRFFASLHERFQMWTISLTLIIAQHPLCGVGLNMFGHTYAAIAPEGAPFYHAGTPYAHNMFIHIFAETGILGLSGFLAFVFFLFRSSLRSFGAVHERVDQALSLGFMGSLVAFLTHGLLESSLQTSQGGLLFWLLAGFIASRSYQEAHQAVK